MRRALPVRGLRGSVLKIPERREDISVIQKYADFVRETFPDSVVDAVFCVKGNDLRAIGAEEIPLVFGVGTNFTRVGRVEGDPDQNEAQVDIVACRFSSLQPADCAMNPEPEWRIKSFAQRALFSLERGPIEAGGRLNERLSQEITFGATFAEQCDNLTA